MASLDSLSQDQLREKRRSLQSQLDEVDAELSRRRRRATPPLSTSAPPTQLGLAEISRYSRQLLLPELGRRGQQRLKQGSVLCVGGGGLGCPSAGFLAAAGVGRVGVADFDEVEESNLHRQVFHAESRLGVNKARSLKAALNDLNSFVDVVAHETSLTSSNALDVIACYDVILDCSDNVATRYLLNDACVMAGKPLVSGSALRFEGQLTVYNYQGGPTYRCLFPQPPPPETVTNCGDGGVLGVVPGVVGVLQASEAIKILAGLGQVLSGKMLLFQALSCTFRTVRLRARQEDNWRVDKLVDYVQFCGQAATDKDKPLELLGDEDRIGVRELRAVLEDGDKLAVLVDNWDAVDEDKLAWPTDKEADNPDKSANLDKQNNPDKSANPEKQNDPDKSADSDKKNNQDKPANPDKPAKSKFALLDVRSKPEQEICRLPHSLNVPIGQLSSAEKLEDLKAKLSVAECRNVYVVCRRGNDSQKAVQKLKAALGDMDVQVQDVRGGLHAWAKQVDKEFPVY